MKFKQAQMEKNHTEEKLFKLKIIIVNTVI